ncbi:low molecular weight protein-tyrosine-phosphatase [Paenibacillus sp. GYB003]|uniref:low molecular weight protein-tyrosine-phosphatase n=1 Tax=Paenibacillus sp. GYB003 TaxID=2994392 RepID=UPI002F967E4C
MVKVLFVCLGNICRSPMAEAVFRRQVRDAGLEARIEVDSAGTGDWHVGQRPHEGTRKLLEKKGIDWKGIVARQVTQGDMRRFDYIVAMDGSNLQNLRAIAGYAGSRPGDGEGSGAEPKLIRLLDLVPETKLEDVPDPYYTGNFEEVYELVEAGCAALLRTIRAELPA